MLRKGSSRVVSPVKQSLAILVAAVLVVTHANAEEPPHTSDDDINALYARVLDDTAAHTVSSPDGKLKAVYRQMHPGCYGRNFARITIHNSAKAIASFDLRDYAGRLVAVARWSPDSRFCVFTTVSAGGHSPWHFDPYIFSVRDRSLYSLAGSTDAVIDPEFRFAQPALLIVTTRHRITRVNLHK